MFSSAGLSGENVWCSWAEAKARASRLILYAGPEWAQKNSLSKQDENARNNLQLPQQQSSVATSLTWDRLKVDPHTYSVVFGAQQTPETFFILQEISSFWARCDEAHTSVWRMTQTLFFAAFQLSARSCRVVWSSMCHFLCFWITSSLRGLHAPLQQSRRRLHLFFPFAFSLMFCRKKKQRASDTSMFLWIYEYFHFNWSSGLCIAPSYTVKVQQNETYLLDIIVSS